MKKKLTLKKLIKTIGEKCKVSIRNIRREANEDLKKKLKDKLISEDDNKNYEKILENELHNFKKDAKLDIMNVGEVWFQQYYKTQFHSPHNHGACGYSSVTYIKFNKDKHTPTIFIAPFTDPKGDIIEFVPEIDEGNIIFFPSMINHYVVPNKSSDIRIILSFNVNIS